MPFGAEPMDDGSTRFRLWAPAARHVDLCLEIAPHPIQIPLNQLASGWFEVVTDRVKTADEYRYQIDRALKVPDPASRYQPKDVHGPSEVIAPEAFEWQDDGWRGRPWEDAVIYEAHVGAFTPQGTFTALSERLDYLSDLGITALELMPVADFPGKRNWGYDGVLLFAPDSTYGRPDELKTLVQHAHKRGIMVLLDVVYNHFGPEGNYLNSYSPQFFTSRHCTPWGNGINFDGPDSRVVRDFFIHNALYWLTEYNFDGLRLDAVHAIIDDSTPDILTELAQAIHRAFDPARQVHLVLENERNQSRYLRRGPACRPQAFTAQWDDDIHHALHVLTSGERDGYYSDYSEKPVQQLGRCLTEGFAYQGEPSPQRKFEPRGEATKGVPLTAFVSFLQNHDQIGNRAFGERIARLADPDAVRAAMAILLLSPLPPLLFMGEEFGADTPFLFFCDFEKDLAAAVTEGRRNEFARFASFNDYAKRNKIPDPSASTTFEASKLNWAQLSQRMHEQWLRFYRQLLKLRRELIVPRLATACRLEVQYQTYEDRGLSAHWSFPDQSRLTLLANLSPSPLSSLPAMLATPFYMSEKANPEDLQKGRLPAWSVAWFLES